MKHIICALTALVLLIAPARAADESAYDRVMRTGKIRCGYVVHDPYVLKNPNTGEMSGVFHDAVEEIAARESLEVEWTEEVGWGNFIQGLKQGRYDMVCSGGWASASEGRHIAFSRPVYYTGVGVWVRADDPRFDGNLEALNSPDVTIASIDKSLVEIIAASKFPEAELHSLPQMSNSPEVLQSVLAGKADATFFDGPTGGNFLENNPGTIKNIAVQNPVTVFPVSFYLPIGDHRLKMMIDAGVTELLYDGTIDKILDRYEAYPGAFYRVEKEYAVPAE